MGPRALSDEVALSPSIEVEPSPGIQQNVTSAVLPDKPRELALDRFNRLEGLAVRSDGLLAAIGMPGEIVRFSFVGGDRATVAGGFASPLALAADDEHLWIADFGSTGGALWQLDARGGGRAQLDAIPRVGLTALALDRDAVYFTTSNDDRVIRVLKRPRPSGRLTVIARGLAGPMRLAADSTHVYVLALGKNPSGEGALVRVGKGGGDPEVLLSGLHNPADLALDDSHVYVSEGGPARTAPTPTCAPGKICPVPSSLPIVEEGRLLRVPKAGGTVQVLADKQIALGPIALDDKTVVLAKMGGLFRVPKTGKKANVWWTSRTHPASHLVVSGAVAFVYVTGELFRLGD